MLYHIIGRGDWGDAQRRGHHVPASLASEGFMHLSYRAQILRPANLLYEGRTDLLLLEIDPGRLRPHVVDEPGSHGEDELFPHLYGRLNVDAVVRVLDFPCGADGSFELPGDLRP